MPHPLVALATHGLGLARAAVPERFSPPVASTARWSPEQARSWRAETGWLCGCNFVPSTAGNQLEMFQAATFDPETIDRELGWAAELGMNSIRLFLHDLLWTLDGDAFLDRLDQVLELAAGHGIRTMPVLFDGVWDPDPRPGPQPEPTPGVHNSTWLQSPGAAVLADERRWPALRGYVEAVVGRFAHDPRVVAWDLFNEPDQPNAISYPRREVSRKTGRVTKLLGQVFDWAAAVDPDAPLTAGVFIGMSGAVERVSPLNRLMLGRSDVLSFHSYAKEPRLVRAIEHLERYERPILCTEWMARTVGSTVELLEVLAARDVGAYCWGLVDGRSQTKHSWLSWRKPEVHEHRWFHDLLHPDGTPYDEAEAELFRRVTAAHR